MQKDSIRKLFAETLKPVNKEMVADEIYMVFESALIGYKVHNDVWPIISARNIAKKLI